MRKPYSASLYTHTYTHQRTNTHRHEDTHTYTHAHICTHTPTHTHQTSHVRTHIHSIQTHAQKITPTHTHTHIHTQTHTQTHTSPRTGANKRINFYLRKHFCFVSQLSHHLKSYCSKPCSETGLTSTRKFGTARTVSL